MSVNGLGGSTPYPQAGASMGAAQRDAHATATAGAFWKDIQGDIQRNPGLKDGLRGCQMRLESLAKDFRAGELSPASFDAEVKAVMAARNELVFQAFQQHGAQADQRLAATSASGEDEEGVFPQAEGAPRLSPEAKALLQDARRDLDALSRHVHGHTLGGQQQQAAVAAKVQQAEAALAQLEAKHLEGPEAHLPADLDAKGVQKAQAEAFLAIKLEVHGVDQLLRSIESDAKRFGPGSNMTEWR